MHDIQETSSTIMSPLSLSFNWVILVSAKKVAQSATCSLSTQIKSKQHLLQADNNNKLFGLAHVLKFGLSLISSSGFSDDGYSCVDL